MECINGIVPGLGTARGALETLQNGTWVRRSFPEVGQDVASAVAFLRSLGISGGQRVGFIGSNCYEWIVADLACLALGVVAVPFEQQDTRSCEDLIRTYQLATLLTDRADRLEQGQSVQPFSAVMAHSSGAGSWTAHRWSPEEILAIKFTSGSTQLPKALAAKAKSADDSIAAVQELFEHQPGDRVLVFLPLQLLQQRYWIYSAILFHFDVIVVSAAHVLAALRVARPTVIMGVPEFFETLRSSFLRDIQGDRCARAELAGYRFINRITGGALSRVLGLPRFKRRLGGRVRYLWTGSAPASRESLRFFAEMGVPLLQGYGMNELCIVSKNSLRHHRRGSVGRLLPNKEVQIGPDGEVLVRNRYEVANGYLHCAAGESERTFRADGFVATGDLGYLDSAGYLYITGRKKDLIVLPSGKKIDPNKIESAVQLSGLVECCLAYTTPGLRIALLLKPRPGIDAAAIEALVQRLNSTFAPEERIAATREIPEPFSVENGLLTSQFKLKRTRILEKYAASGGAN
jgi:long-subunit acyl-CoA synthetase (AMP-forming)